VGTGTTRPGRPHRTPGSWVRERQAARLVGLLFALFLTGCARLPEAPPPAPSYVEDTANTTLARRFEAAMRDNPGLSGIRSLVDGRDALGVRLAAAAAAERSLDAQYFIWHDDIAGTLLFDALRAAGERGVRVRLLLDDANTRGLDPVLVALDAHPRIEVRVFNAFAQRGARYLGFATDFARLNRRMHNKSFTVDNRVTIVGGRNIGDEYFGSGAGPLFGDLDVFAAGPVVAAVSAQFDRYWNSAAAYPIAAFASRTPPLPEPLEARAAALRADEGTQRWLASIDWAGIDRVLGGDASLLHWVPARLATDDPSKITGDADPGQRRIMDDFAEVIGPAQRRADLVSPYFVPGAAGTRRLAELARRGVAVRVLTNSLNATNHPVVHAGYLKRRRPLLEAGVRLYEMKSELDENTTRQRGFAASSGAVLHAKTFAVDDRWVFVGSFNFDPRSVSLNTEMGLILDDPRLARSIGAAFEKRIPQAAWEVRLGATGGLEWVDTTTTPPTVLTREPEAGLLTRAGLRMLSWLPLDWML
jgi:putative cardiolipin synthase